MPLHRVPLRGEFPFQKVTVILLCLAHTVVTEPGVKCKLLGPPVIGGNATLRCHLPGSFEVLQVTWQRSKDGFREKIATYSKRYGVNVLSPFTKRVEVNTDPKKSSMKVSALTEEDEACYICVFNVYQHGAYTGQVCLPALVSNNEFICSADGSQEHIPKITLNPPKTNTDPTLQSEGGIIRAIRKGTLRERENLTCTFQLLRMGRQKQDITEEIPGDTASPSTTEVEVSLPSNAIGPEVLNALGSLVEKCLKPTQPFTGFGYRKLRFFSGKQPTPQGEEDFESWMDQASQAVEEWDIPETQKKQRIAES
ncbi:uncharacterized protein LOC108645831 [Xenopus tropicalis]|uniref:Uncharacterized protein LOC108645831 n=1 Tax=Xenopus tropicalis TaxID=8364 RepID=A0A8J1J630_XENTR|nr:uncharacterized protein LOC108645831 [Xenopus tropicalis]